MKIITAAAAGMCFGVRDALDALAAIDQPRSVAIYGELVHNDIVLHQLEARGFQQLAEKERAALPAASHVVITAHGISQRRRHELVAAGKTLIDTTCPLVARVHRAAQDLARSGAFVVIIGHPEHVEVEGIIGDLDAFAVVPSVAAVCEYPAAKIGVVCQTTFPCDEAAAIRRQIAMCNPAAEIHWVDTICQPTKDRQEALYDLFDQVEAVVVVGGSHSHNTLRLVDACRRRGLPACHIEHAAEIDPDWFGGFETVGLTAGTSTLPETIRQVHDRLKAIAVELSSVDRVASFPRIGSTHGDDGYRLLSWFGPLTPGPSPARGEERLSACSQDANAVIFAERPCGRIQSPHTRRRLPRGYCRTRSWPASSS